MSDTYTKSAPLEGSFQSRVVAYGKRRGWLMQKLVSQSANGWPDLVAIRKGRVIFIETKNESGTGRLSANQRMRHIGIVEHGGEVHTISTIEEAHDILY